jgi:hypothetical protein
VVVDSRGTWDKERKQVTIRGKSALNSINICMARAPNIEVKVAEQVYNALVESRMMAGVEIWGLEDGWKEIKKVHELFCKRVMGKPNTAANGACVRELGRTNGKDKVIERVLRYWQRLLEMDEMSLLGDVLKQQSLQKGKNWLNKIKQELEGLGMGDIWIMGEENNRNIWREVSKRCMDIERQNMEASMTEKRSLVFYNELKNNWEKKLYIEVCSEESRRGIGWWKMGIRKLKGVRENIERNMPYV